MKFHYTLLLSILIGMLAPLFTVHAATIYFQPIEGRHGIDDEFIVKIFLDPAGESVNAVEGSIEYPTDLLELNGVYNGDSVIELWLDEPKVRKTTDSKGIISFAGLVPLGFDGVRKPLIDEKDAGLLLSLAFRTKKPGEGAIVFSDAQVLLNDGEGSETEVTLLPFPVRVFHYVGEQRNDLDDGIPPEPFSIFEGETGSQKFLAFQTTDKQSGVSRYEIAFSKNKVREPFDGLKWEQARSPFLLDGVAVQKFVYVRAVDVAGNVQVAEYSIDKFSFAQYKNSRNLGIIILILFGFVIWRTYIIRQKSQS